MIDTYDSLLGDLTSAEYSIVGLAMHNPAVMDDVDLSPDDFQNVSLGALYALLADLTSEGSPTDPASVCGSLERLRTGGGRVRGITPADILKMYGDAPASGAYTYARIIRNFAIRRRVIMACEQGSALAKSQGSTDEIVEQVRAMVDETSRSVAQSWDMDDAYSQFVAQVGEPVVYHPTMWPALNDVMGGYRGGALYTIGARPGTGKSIYAVQAVLDLAEQGQVVWHSMEMGDAEVFTRLTANVARINTRRIDGSGGEMRPEDWMMLREHQNFIRKLPLTLDTKRRTMNQIRSTVRTASRRGKVSGVVIDQLGNIAAPPWARSEYEKITYHTDQLKALAGEFDVPVIVMAQLNREVEKRTSAVPNLADLRSSGSIEQDSDVVLFLYDGQEEGFGIHVAKNRQGPKDVTVPLVRRGQFSRLDNPS